MQKENETITKVEEKNAESQQNMERKRKLKKRLTKGEKTCEIDK